jgi:hypothetical protein
MSKYRVCFQDLNNSQLVYTGIEQSGSVMEKEGIQRYLIMKQNTMKGKLRFPATKARIDPLNQSSVFQLNPFRRIPCYT